MNAPGKKLGWNEGADRIGPGTFVAVVGPSGVGKDTLIRAVRAEVGSDPRFYFVRRIVTRQVTLGDEDHDTIESAAFELMFDENRYALAWRAHGHAYALPLSLDEAVAAGRIAIANLSRAVLDDARRRYRSCFIVELTAPAAVLHSRLATRGRESAEEIQRRLRRADAAPIEGADILKIDNSGPLVNAQSRFHDILLRLAGSTTVPPHQS